jgi:F0F1-type ATP synthase alpha subunit
LIEFESGLKALVLNLEEVGAVLFVVKNKEGYQGTGKIASVEVAMECLDGLDTLGHPIDGKGPRWKLMKCL